MNKPVLLAAMVAALPLGAGAQQGNPGSPTQEAQPQPGCPGVEEAPRASSALPARASTKPEPQLGSVAPNSRVPSHVVTPSMRAMRAVIAKEAARATGAAPGAGTACVPPAAGGATEDTSKG